MDFKAAMNQMKVKEQALAKEKEKLKKAALEQIAELIATFDINPNELFKSSKSPSKPSVSKPSLDYSTFEVGKIYTDGKNDYKFASRGKRPDWLKKAIQSGKSAQNLLKKAEKTPS